MDPDALWFAESARKQEATLSRHERSEAKGKVYPLSVKAGPIRVRSIAERQKRAGALNLRDRPGE
jgi:hypothetical protein